MFIVHAQNCHISTSCLKLNVTIVFLNLNFLKDTAISVIREGWCDVDPTNLFLLWGVFKSVTI